MSNTCKIKAGNLVFELDATDEKVLFEKLAHVQEIFDQKCEKCGSTDIKFVVRNVESGKKEYTYMECRCNNKDCRARLSFGTKQTGELFPKRKDSEGNYIGTYGWGVWNKDEERVD